MVSRAPRSRRPGGFAGFTLIELMMVVALLALLVSLASPSMARLLAAQRLKSAASQLHLALVKTRSEAIKRNALVTLQPVTGSNWASGWRILSGVDQLDLTQPPATIAVTANPNPTAAVTYRPDGRLTLASTHVTFQLAADGVSSKRCVSVDTAGRPSVKEATTC